MHAPFDTYGVTLDRNWMLVDPNTGRFLSQRTTPRLCLVETQLFSDFLILEAPDMSEYWLSTIHHPGAGQERTVSVWDSTCVGIDQGDDIAKWFSAYLRQECRLVRIPPDHNRFAKQGNARVGFADSYSALVITTSSLDDLNGRLDDPVPMNRFRPNIVISAEEPYAEDHWGRIQIGDMEFDGTTLCARCAIPSTDQSTAKRHKEPNATLAQYRRGHHLGMTDEEDANDIYFGRNMNHNGPGEIRVGDRVTILETD